MSSSGGLLLFLLFMLVVVRRIANGSYRSALALVVIPQWRHQHAILPTAGERKGSPPLTEENLSLSMRHDRDRTGEFAL